MIIPKAPPKEVISIVEDTSTESDSATDSNPDDDYSAGGSLELKEHTIDIIRDSKNNYAPLERYFGLLTQGMAFGESCLLNPHEDVEKFYHTIAMCTTEVLQIDLQAYRNILAKQQNRILAEKMQFIKNIPELDLLVASKQRIICENMF